MPIYVYKCAKCKKTGQPVISAENFKLLNDKRVHPTAARQGLRSMRSN